MSDTSKAKLLVSRENLRQILVQIQSLESSVDQAQAIFDDKVSEFLATIPDIVNALVDKQEQLEVAEEALAPAKETFRVDLLGHWELTGEKSPFGVDDITGTIKVVKKTHYDDDELATALADINPELVGHKLKKKELNKWIKAEKLFTEGEDGFFDLQEQYKDLPITMTSEASTNVSDKSLISLETGD